MLLVAVLFSALIGGRAIAADAPRDDGAPPKAPSAGDKKEKDATKAERSEPADSGVTKDEAPAKSDKSKEPPAKDGGAKTPAPAKKAAAAKKPLANVKLPEAGEHRAAEIFVLAEGLWARSIDLEKPDVGDVRLQITEGLAGQRVTREELTIFLGAYGIYLFPKDASPDGPLVATRNARWKPPAPEEKRFARTFQLRARTFDAVRKEVETFIAAKNRTRGPNVPAAGVAADPRSCRLVVRAASERVLAGVEEIVAKGSREQEEREKEGEHLHAFKPAHARVSALEEQLLGKLNDSQRKAVTVRAVTGRNVLLVRASEETWRRIEPILQELDVAPEGGVQRVERGEEAGEE